MAIDPELKELIADLDRLNAQARTTAGMADSVVARGQRHGAFTPLSEIERQVDEKIKKERDGGSFNSGRTGVQFRKKLNPFRRDIRNDIMDAYNLASSISSGDEMGALSAAIGLMPPVVQLPARLVHSFFTRAIDNEKMREQNMKELREFQKLRITEDVGLGETTAAYVAKVHASMLVNATTYQRAAISASRISNTQLAALALLPGGQAAAIAALAARNEGEAVVAEMEKDATEKA